MPTFCRHNRFVERCPICSKTLPGRTPSGASSSRAKTPGPARAGGGSAQRKHGHSGALRIRREGRAEEDGYRSDLVPGLRASADASRLAQEIAFSSGRLLALAAEPPGLYGEAHALAGESLERATWTCFLIAYLSPLESDDPFAGIRLALTDGPGELPDLDDIPLGPRTSHDRARGTETLVAYDQWVQRGGTAGAAPQSASVEGGQAVAFTGDPAWSPGRRFERVFERLALPGLTRMARYDLLVTLGRLGLYSSPPTRYTCQARAGSRRMTRRRWQPSACSASAIRSCWSAARPHSPGKPRSRSRRLTWHLPTGSPRSGQAWDARRRPTMTPHSSGPATCWASELLSTRHTPLGNA